MKKFALLALLLLESSALAYPGQAFNNQHDAAIDALSSIYDYSNLVGHEFGGYVYTDYAGNYYAMPPHSNNSACSISLDELAQPGNGFGIIAAYHTHPYYIDSDAENFSAIPGDRFAAMQRNIQLYVMTPTKAVKQFIPPQQTTDPLHWLTGVVFTNVHSQVPTLFVDRYFPDEC